MKIGIDAGHGNVRGGAVGYADENIQNEKIANRVEAKLKKYCEVVRLDDNSERGNSLNDRTNKAKKENVDMIISIHANAGGGEGIETYIHNEVATEKDRRFAELVQNKLIEKTNFKNRGIKMANFHMLREGATENRVEVLLELGFVDNLNDANKMNTDTFINQCTEAIVSSVIEFYDLKQATNSSTTIIEQKNTDKEFEKKDLRIGEYQQILNKIYNAGLKVDEWWGQDTASKTKKHVALKRGMKNELVRWVQKRLIELGFSCGRCGADGHYGTEKSHDTENAVGRFQEKYGLKVDKVAGIEVIRKVVELM